MKPSYNDQTLDALSITRTQPATTGASAIPMGNGTLGASAWIDPAGDLLLNIAPVSAWTQSATTQNVARVRVNFSPNPYSATKKLVEHLRLSRGRIEITLGNDNDNQTISTWLWLDASRNAINVESQSRTPFAIQAQLELLTIPAVELRGDALFASHLPAISDTTAPADPGQWVTADHPLADASLLWRHTPALGGVVTGRHCQRINDTTIASDQPRERQSLRIHLLTSEAADTLEWISDLEAQISLTDAIDTRKARDAHQKHWRIIWKQSNLRNLSDSHESRDENQSYVLKRYIQASLGLS